MTIFEESVLMKINGVDEVQGSFSDQTPFSRSFDAYRGSQTSSAALSLNRTLIAAVHNDKNEKLATCLNRLGTSSFFAFWGIARRQLVVLPVNGRSYQNI
jgi:hypothetical protein